MKSQTVIINGIVFDTTTGKPVSQARSTDIANRHNAGNIHSVLQKSETLNRRYVHKPDTNELAATEPIAIAEPISEPTVAKISNFHSSEVGKAPTEQVTKSPEINRFHILPNEPELQTPPTLTIPADVEPATHPLIDQIAPKLAANQVKRTPVQRFVKPSDIIKREAIAEATAKMPDKSESRRTRVKNKSRTSRTKNKYFTKLVSLGSAAMAVLVLGAYFTYLNMPSISTRVAASQAGIDASYPNFHPMGYSLNGPVAYQPGKVSMKFAANSGPESYTLDQTKSSWDSSALLEYLVTPKAGDNYMVTTANGLTIYTFGNNSVWVNNGILYSISGSAVLSNSQIQRIATSL